MANNATRLGWGLFFLRLGLASFLALHAIDKFVAPLHTVRMYSTMYSMDIKPSLAMILGALELVLSILFFFGMYKVITYGVALLLQTFFTIFLYFRLLTPFGVGHLLTDSLPILFAFFTLFLLKEYDTKLSLAKRKTIFS